MQNDGNLVLYTSTGAIWSSGTAGIASPELDMQSDGNLVVYSGHTSSWNIGVSFADAPGPPTISVTPGNQSVTVSFQANGYSGGSAVSYFTVTKDPGGTRIFTGTSPVTTANSTRS